jgi:hypothetical protein
MFRYNGQLSTKLGDGDGPEPEPIDPKVTFESSVAQLHNNAVEQASKFNSQVLEKTVQKAWPEIWPLFSSPSPPEYSGLHPLTMLTWYPDSFCNVAGM